MPMREGPPWKSIGLVRLVQPHFPHVIAQRGMGALRVGRADELHIHHVQMHVYLLLTRVLVCLRAQGLQFLEAP